MKLVDIISMIQGLIDKINAKTGKEDATLADAVDRVTSSSMIDTSGATAIESDIVRGKTAFVDGVKVTGNMSTSSGQIFISEDIQWEDSGTVGLRFNAKITKKTAYIADSTISIKTPKSNLGDATEEDVTAGKTFTSAAGLKKIGTAEMFKKKSGTVEIAGDTGSFVIDTGLSKVDTIMVKKDNPGDKETYFWAGKSEITCICATGVNYINIVSPIDITGGKVTCRRYSTQYPIKAGTFKWVAYGS